MADDRQRPSGSRRWRSPRRTASRRARRGDPAPAARGGDARRPRSPASHRTPTSSAARGDPARPPPRAPSPPSSSPPAPPDADDARRRALIDPSPHPDLVWLRPPGAQHLVDEMRESVIRAASLRPAEGEHRVFVIEEAEALRDESQNALLKTLEEPALVRPSDPALRRAGDARGDDPLALRSGRVRAARPGGRARLARRERRRGRGGGATVRRRPRARPLPAHRPADGRCGPAPSPPRGPRWRRRRAPSPGRSCSRPRPRPEPRRAPPRRSGCWRRPRRPRSAVARAS